MMLYYRRYGLYALELQWQDISHVLGLLVRSPLDLKTNSPWFYFDVMTPELRIANAIQIVIRWLE